MHDHAEFGMVEEPLDHVDRDLWRGGVIDIEIGFAATHHPNGPIDTESHRDFDPIHVRGSQRVRLALPGRVPHECEGATRHVSGDGCTVVGRS